MELKEIRWEGVDWIHLAQEQKPVAGSYEHGKEPWGPIKDMEFLD
jgi:hypothetical protein